MTAMRTIGIGSLRRVTGRGLRPDTDAMRVTGLLQPGRPVQGENAALTGVLLTDPARSDQLSRNLATRAFGSHVTGRRP